MSYHDCFRCSRLIACSMIALFCPAALGQTQNSANAPLPLPEAEQLALAKDPMVRQREAQAQAFSERAVAEGQLPDPQLSLGLVEVPSDFDTGGGGICAWPGRRLSRCSGL